MMKKILMIGLLCLCLCGCEDQIEITDKTDNSNNENRVQEQTDNKEQEYKLNQAFVFDELEIVVSDQYSFVTVDNSYSEQHGKSVVKVPVTIKNLKAETHNLNMFYFKLYGSQGIELDSVSSYFDESVDYAGELRTDASYTKYFYFLYDGDGKYTIEFDNWNTKLSIDIDIVK